MNRRIIHYCVPIVATLKSIMPHSDAAHKGGAATAIVNREKAAKDYVLSPALCLFCKSVIPVQDWKKYSTARRQKYCSRTCAAKNNNRIAPKRSRRPRPCASCGVDVSAHRYTNRKYCTKCWELQLLEFSRRTLREVTKTAVSENARTVMNDTVKACAYCGYDKHAEVCHLRPIRSFPLTATMAEVNAKVNLRYCCPNHHWELDHGLLAQVSA